MAVMAVIVGNYELHFTLQNVCNMLLYIIIISSMTISRLLKHGKSPVTHCQSTHNTAPAAVTLALLYSQLCMQQY